MTFASVATLGSNTEKTSDNSLTLAVSAAAEVGNLVIVAIALDNNAAADGETSLVSSVTDDSSNTYTKLKEYTNAQGAAAAGATISLWKGIISTQLNSTANITVALAANVQSKAISAWEFTRDTSKTVTLQDSTFDVGDASDPAAMTLSSLPSQPYLLISAWAGETTVGGGYTTDADYTALTRTGTSGGSGISNMSVGGGFRIATLTTDTYDATANAVDYAQVYVALYEASSGTQTPQAVSGAITPSGTVVIQTGKPLAGSLPSSGALINRAGKILSGELTSSGVLAAIKIALISLGGELTMAGSLILQTGKSLAGALAPDGALVRSSRKILSGALTSGGVLVNQTRKLLSGEITPSGVVTAIKIAIISLGGELTMAGALVLRTGKSLAGTLTPDGGLVRSTSKILAGAISPSGGLGRLIGKILSGMLDLAGTVARLKSGQAEPIITAWTLRNRSLSWTLQDRDTAWSLNDRDLTWTVEDR